MQIFLCRRIINESVSYETNCSLELIHVLSKISQNLENLYLNLSKSYEDEDQMT